MPLSVKTWGMAMAASTASIAVLGAWYGAGLKEDQKTKQVGDCTQPARLITPITSFNIQSTANDRYVVQRVQARKEVTPAERIALLEQTKAGLVLRKSGLENKIKQLEARISGSEETQPAQGRSF